IVIDSITQAVHAHQIPADGTTWETPMVAMTSELDANHRIEITGQAWFEEALLKGWMKHDLWHSV
ncbi:MAG TPA: hypothetical protein VF855_11555, partial [Acidimicrobiales bacterium]